MLIFSLSTTIHKKGLIVKLSILILSVIIPLSSAEFYSEYFDFSDAVWIENQAEMSGGDGMKEYPMVHPYYVREFYSGPRSFRTLHSRSDETLRVGLAPNCSEYVFNYYFGELIEWRFADERPFAIIYRIQSVDEEGIIINEHLIVRSLDGKLNEDINVRETKNANEAARKIADSHCIID
ncbi:hypothetical protein CHISP_2283 [Chitinispirillum alkaliphilum]|nr:hypothetical protein CHISP_2283 [Chitinispirillum alkaliphilum]